MILKNVITEMCIGMIPADIGKEKLTIVIPRIQAVVTMFVMLMRVQTGIVLLVNADTVVLMTQAV